MGLTSSSTFWLAILLSVGSVISTVWLWPKLAKNSISAFISRFLCLLVCQLSLLFCVLLGINNHFSFYVSWNELFGIGSNETETQITGWPGSSAPIHSQKTGVLRDIYSVDNSGQLWTARVTGPNSGLRNVFYVHVPDEYMQPENANVSYPVIVLLSGYPGHASSWISYIKIDDVQRQAINAGAEPAILVIPEVNIYGRDLECQDLPNQPKIGQFLTQDLPVFVKNTWRARTTQNAWGVAGVSSGGFCAASIATRFPNLFHAAASISGDVVPTGKYFDKMKFGTKPGTVLPALAAAPDVALLATSSKEDKLSYPPLKKLMANYRAPTTLTTSVSPTGGHNFKTWSKQFPLMFSWFSAVLYGPTN